MHETVITDCTKNITTSIGCTGVRLCKQENNKHKNNNEAQGQMLEVQYVRVAACGCARRRHTEAEHSAASEDNGAYFTERHSKSLPRLRT